jgi:predicted lipid-binding transport protein (Tim44 family)
MSDLSTADLAGGTTPRARESDPAVRSRDPKLDTHDADARSFDTKPSDADFANAATRERTSTPATPPAAGSTPARTSQLANPAATDGARTNTDQPTAMFPAGEVEGFRSRWMDVQTGFVDEPRSAVEQADSLVAEMMKRLAQVFADERGKLEEQWSRGDDISTEDLRQALRRYRSFMDRLLSV